MKQGLTSSLSVQYLCYQVLVEKGRAVGVEYSRDGARQQVRVNKEVLLAAGAVGSPQLLMLSGVGPKKHLDTLGVRIRVFCSSCLLVAPPLTLKLWNCPQEVFWFCPLLPHSFLYLSFYSFLLLCICICLSVRLFEKNASFCLLLFSLLTSRKLTACGCSVTFLE